MMIKWAADAVAVPVDGSMVVRLGNTGLLHVLDPISSGVVARIGAGSEVDALIDSVERDYAAPVGEVRRETTALLSELVKVGILLPFDTA